MQKPQGFAGSTSAQGRVSRTHQLSKEVRCCTRDEGILVTCLGNEQVAEFEAALEGSGIEVHMAGDCPAPRTAEGAVLEGLKVGCAL